MQDIKSKELREKYPSTNTIICFEVRATALHPCLHTEGFSHPLRIFHKGTSTEKLQLTTGSTQFQLSHTSTQEGRHKAKHKAKKNLQLGDHKDHKQYLMISKDHK